MSDDTTHLKLPFLAEGQQHKDVTVNEALNRLDAVIHLGVRDRDLAAPPEAPAEGDRHIVAAGGTGAWTGCDGQIAAFFDGAWTCFAPEDGWTAWVADEEALLLRRGGAWVDLGTALKALQNLERLGVGTTADTGNPFAAKLNTALWTARAAAEGGSGDLRYVLNKEAAANTASLLFQDGYSGRAEIGLAGDDDFHFKVSADGAAWSEGLVLSRTDGAARFPRGVSGGLVLPQTKAVLDAMAAVPPLRRQRLLDELVSELIYAGVWAKLDALWLLAAHTQQAALVNLKAPGTYNLVAVNAPAFAADRGFTGDGTAAHLDPNIKLNALAQFRQNSACASVWSLSDRNVTQDYALGSDGYRLIINPRDANSQYRVRITGSATTTAGASASSVGHFALSRTDSAGYTIYRNGAAAAAVTDASTAPLGDSLHLLRAVTLYNARQIAAASIGAGLSADEVGGLHRALRDYLSAVGAAT